MSLHFILLRPVISLVVGEPQITLILFFPILNCLQNWHWSCPWCCLSIFSSVCLFLFLQLCLAEFLCHARETSDVTVLFSFLDHCQEVIMDAKGIPDYFIIGNVVWDVQQFTLTSHFQSLDFFSKFAYRIQVSQMCRKADVTRVHLIFGRSLMFLSFCITSSFASVAVMCVHCQLCTCTVSYVHALSVFTYNVSFVRLLSDVNVSVLYIYWQFCTCTFSTCTVSFVHIMSVWYLYCQICICIDCFCTCTVSYVLSVMHMYCQLCTASLYENKLSVLYMYHQLCTCTVSYVYVLAVMCMYFLLHDCFEHVLLVITALVMYCQLCTCTVIYVLPVTKMYC